MKSADPERSPLLFRYPGGKHYAISLLRPFWESVEHDEYREPFVGGGSVFFNKPKVAINWINDIDSELVATYQTIADKKTRLRLTKELSGEIATKTRWREIFEGKTISQFEIAKKYYYLNRTSFSGKLISPAWGYRDKRSLPPHRWGERIIPCGEKLEDAKITSVDFADVITTPSSKKVLMFVDPPYFSPLKRKHYRHGFVLNDHIRLMEVLKKTKFRFILTYDDSPEVRELYKWAKLYTVNFFYRVENSAIQVSGLGIWSQCES
jgi:DNA adenine methylase